MSYVQYIKGENILKIEPIINLVEDNGVEYYSLGDGSRISVKLENDYFIRLNNINEARKIEDIDFGNNVQPNQNYQVGTTSVSNNTDASYDTGVPHPDDYVKMQQFRMKQQAMKNNTNTPRPNPNINHTTYNSIPTNNNTQTPEKNSKNPVEILIENSKLNNVKLKIELDVNLPDKRLYKILKENLPDINVLDCLADHVIKSENDESFTNALMKSLEKHYERNTKNKKNVSGDIPE